MLGFASAVMTEKNTKAELADKIDDDRESSYRITPYNPFKILSINFDNSRNQEVYLQR